MPKFQVTMKDPDGSFESIREEAERQVNAMPDLDDDERDTLIDKRVEKLNEFTEQWMEYGEYITIEFDTDAKTATVVKKK